MLHTFLSSHFKVVFLSQTSRIRHAMTRNTRSQIDRETFMIVDISFRNDQDQSFNDQDTHILNAKNNFHIDLDVNVVDLNEQRFINNAQIDILRNANVVSNEMFRAESNVVSNEAISVALTSSIQFSFIRILVYKTRNDFLKNIIRIIFKMSNTRVSKTIRLMKFFS
jgi:hypothetical protein